MTDRLALPPRYRDQLEALLSKHVPGVEVWAYGSRVNGESHDGSDLDLVLRGPALEPLDGGFYDLLEAIEKSNIPILVQTHDWAMLPESFHREIEQAYVIVQRGAKQTTVGGWTEVTLGEVAQVRSGFAFKSKDWTDSGIPVVKIANVKDGNLVMDGCAFVSAQVAAQANQFNLNEGDILIALTGYVGEVAMVRRRDLPAVLNQRVGMFSISDTSMLDRGYLFQLLCDPTVREHIDGLAYGSAQPNISPSLIHGVTISLPPLSEQRAIAHILGTLDDKIELNRRMNETLEEMARALFKSWFVDFEPVRAKMEGRWRRGESLPGLPAEHYDLFPDRLVDSELGEVPEGWEVKESWGTLKYKTGSLAASPKTSGSGYLGGVPVIGQHCEGLAQERIATCLPWTQRGRLPSQREEQRNADVQRGNHRYYSEVLSVGWLASYIPWRWFETATASAEHTGIQSFCHLSWTVADSFLSCRQVPTAQSNRTIIPQDITLIEIRTGTDLIWR